MPVVPVQGFGLSFTIQTGSRAASALGPFPTGCILKEARIFVYLQVQTAITALRLGLALSSIGEETDTNFFASPDLLRVQSGAVVPVLYHRLELASNGHYEVIMPLGVRIESGPRWVIVYHQREDGTDVFDLNVSVSAVAVLREAGDPGVPPGGGVPTEGSA